MDEVRVRILPKYSSDGGLSMSNSIFLVRRSSSSSGWATGAPPWETDKQTEAGVNKAQPGDECSKGTDNINVSLFNWKLWKARLYHMKMRQRFEVKQSTLAVINIHWMVLSQPFPSEISDPGSGPTAVLPRRLSYGQHKYVGAEKNWPWLILTFGK